MTAAATSTGIQRFRYMTDPGEPLEVASSVLRSAVRHRVWVTDTGIDPVWVRPNPLCCVPLPTYPETWPPGLRRWPRVRGAMMWHPLLWLPDRLATRYILDDDGVCTPEPDDIWCLRVCLELQAAGLYDADTGTWLDVLSLAGLNGNDPDTAGRVDRWLAGTRPGAGPARPDRARRPAGGPGLGAARRDRRTARDAGHLLGADRAGPAGRLRGADRRRGRRPGTSPAVRLDYRDARGDQPRDGPDELEIDDGSPTESKWWKGMRRRLQDFTGDPNSLINTVVGDIADRLGAIIDSHAPDASELIAEQRVDHRS